MVLFQLSLILCQFAIFSIAEMLTGFVQGTLVTAELFALGNQTSIPRKCALCGKLFISYSRKNIFCKNLSPEYGNKPCNEVGPMIKREMQRETNVVENQYENSYRAYFNWKNKQIGNLERYLEQQKSELSKREVITLKKEIEDVKRDIILNFQKWVDHCRIIRDEWREKMIEPNGGLDNAALLEQSNVLDLIKLKPVKMRPEKYTQWKENQRIMKGLE